MFNKKINYTKIFFISSNLVLQWCHKLLYCLINYLIDNKMPFTRANSVLTLKTKKINYAQIETQPYPDHWRDTADICSTLIRVS